MWDNLKVDKNYESKWRWMLREGNLELDKSFWRGRMRVIKQEIH